MFVIRATSKLLGKLGVDPEVEPPRSSGALGDWFATLLQVRRGRFVLAISSATLLPVVVLGRDLGTLPSRLASGMVEVLSALGVAADAVERERLAMTETSYARTDDRSTVGVLTELHRLLKYDLDARPTATLLELSLRLSKTPIVAREVFPNNATRALFGLPPARV
jgi:hypothetical protein